MDLSSLVSGVLVELGKLTLNAAINKAAELNNVRGQVLAWQPELELIHAKLEDVKSKDKSKTGEAWMKQVEVEANRMHNVIETYNKIEEIRRNKFKFWKKPQQLNELSAEIKSITDRLNSLKDYSPQLAIIVGNVDPTPLPITRTYRHRDVDDPEVVGLDSDKHRILKQLLDESISRRTVLSIIGVGGLGKTTLAKKVYNSSELEGRFQCCAWQSISQNFNENNILREILNSIKPEMRDKKPPLEDKYLVTEVKSHLSDKRYLIILDDVWEVDHWDGLKKALPDAKNGSRVIITTRSLNVARTADHNTEPYKLDYLIDDESMTLLFRTALQRLDNYPPDLKDVAQRLIKKCGGLPLALVVLGGILSTEEENSHAWELVYRTMNWHDKDVMKKCMNILAMSYEALPDDHLKQCFLYFACFPEDYNISAKHMTRMWVVDELIPKDGARSLKDRAEKYLQELVKRCLVEVTKISRNGYCKYCRMHDLLRDLAVHKAKEINFATVFSKDGGGGDQQLAPNRVALQYCAPTDFDTHSTSSRSLLCFGKNIPNYQQFRQLRVLLFVHIHMDNITTSTYKNWFEGLVHLRYLGFRYCRTDYHTQTLWNISLSGLMSLETLDCKGTKINANSSLWEIPTLRHVIARLGTVVQSPLDWSHLKNLQRLDWVRLNNIPTLECDVNLHTLKINAMYIISKEVDVVDSYDNRPVEERWQGIRALLSRTKHLVSLTINSVPQDLPFLGVGTSGLSCHENIQSLWLRGPWWVRGSSVSMSVEMFPKYLTKLKLDHSLFKEDPMPILKRLQSLRILHLQDCSYLGTKMVCSTRGFASLQELKLKKLEFLTDWVIEEGALPVLRKLEIDDCIKLDTLPELQNVSSLQELIVTQASPQLCERSKTEDQHKIEHVPSVRITMERL